MEKKHTLITFLALGTALFLFFNGCIEHKIYLDLLPDESIRYQILSSGDLEDLYDLDFPLPDSPEWQIKDFIQTRNQQKIYYHEARRIFIHGDSIPSTFYQGQDFPSNIFPQHPVELKVNNYWFFKKFHFLITFQNRRINEKYPALAQYLKNKEIPTSSWLMEILRYIFLTSLDEALKSGGKGLSPSAVERCRSTLIDSIISRSENFQGQLNSETWKQLVEDLQTIILRELEISIDHPFMQSFLRKFRILEQEARINLKLQDDAFTLHLTMPGKIITTNCTQIQSDTLIWKFNLAEFMSQDYLMEASSIYYFKKRILFLLILLLAIILIYGTRIYLNVKRRRSQ